VIVVSDTSPLNYLVLIGSIDVLPELFDEVYAPHDVVRELLHPATPEPVLRWAQAPPPWFRMITPVTPVVTSAGLGPGEASAIALAKELGQAHLLIDERQGTLIARAQGLTVFGTLAVLERAAANGLLDLPDALQRLRGTTFRMSNALLREALERDAARRRSQPPR
jgi:predicted nucleic acid-binding protein